MKPAYILLAMLLFICTIHAQNRDSIFVQTYTDSVCIWNINIPATCGASYMTSVSIIGDSIAILETDTSKEHFRCPCNFSVSVTLIGLAVEDYRASIFRNGWSLTDSFFVGSVDFAVQQSGSHQFSINSYSSACHEIVAVSDAGIGIPKSFSLLGNYPNPFNPVTIIRYQIHRRSKVKLEIFDELGRFLAALVDEEKPLGDYEVPWNASNFSSGFYLCKLTAGNEVQTWKMTLLK
jgi:hypothetical protein